MLEVSNISSLFVHLASRAQQEEDRQARGMKSCYLNKSCSHTKSKHQGKDTIFKITAEVYRMWKKKKDMRTYLVSYWNLHGFLFLYFCKGCFEDTSVVTDAPPPPLILNYCPFQEHWLRLSWGEAAELESSLTSELIRHLVSLCLNLSLNFCTL